MPDVQGRTVVNAHATPFREYEMEGPGVLRVKSGDVPADSRSDSRLGTDGNQPGLELRVGAADDAALLIPSRVRGGMRP